MVFFSNEAHSQHNMVRGTERTTLTEGKKGTDFKNDEIVIFWL